MAIPKQCYATTFVYKGITFAVRVICGLAQCQYRDVAHLGGPWSDVNETLQLKYFDGKFRKLLEDAAKEALQRDARIQQEKRRPFEG